MGHALTTNQTPYKLEPLFLRDEHGHPVLAVLIKGTFAIAADGRCQAAEKQLPLNLTGESFGDDPATSSLKYEPEVAFFKPATDVVMNGHAYAPRSGTTEMMVGLRVGPVQKQVRVCGDRAWYRAGGKVGVTRAATFEKMPLTWERSFGGWDRSHQDPRRHTCELRNPVGVGYRSAGLFEEQIRLPNLEAPGEPIKAFGDQPAPAGFGFVSSHWQPRAALAGTFDERWHKERSPLLPKDFDRRHFNAAPADQVVTGYLRGDEPVTVMGATRGPRATLSFNLPGKPFPQVRVALRNGGEHQLGANLDTVIIEPDDLRVLLLWRVHVALRTGPHDVTAIEVSSEPAPR